MRVLVTGALGWTAKAIIEALVTEQYQVSGLDLPLATSHANTELFAHIHRGTVSDYDFVLKATKDTDVIVHLAVATGCGYNTPTIPLMLMCEELRIYSNQQYKIIYSVSY